MQIQQTKMNREPIANLIELKEYILNDVSNRQVSEKDVEDEFKRLDQEGRLIYIKNVLSLDGFKEVYAFYLHDRKDQIDNWYQNFVSCKDISTIIRHHRRKEYIRKQIGLIESYLDLFSDDSEKKTSQGVNMMIMKLYKRLKGEQESADIKLSNLKDGRFIA